MLNENEEKELERIIAATRGLTGMVKNSELYKKYFLLLSAVKMDASMKYDLNEFKKISSLIAEKIKHKTETSQKEAEDFKNITEKISSNKLILEYLSVEKDYLQLQYDLQSEIIKIFQS